MFIGPSDLAASLGHIGNFAHPEVQKAIEEAARRLKAVGKAAGILTVNEEEARRYIDWGFTFVAVGADMGVLAVAQARWRPSSRRTDFSSAFHTALSVPSPTIRSANGRRGI